MNNARKQPTAAEREAMLRDLDLLPQREAKRRTDGLLRAMLASPPDPHMPKAKPKKRAK